MIALLLVAFFQSAAPASEAATPAMPPAKAAKPACRKETVVGSTIKKRVCPRRMEEVADIDAADEAKVAQAPRDAAVAQAK